MITHYLKKWAKVGILFQLAAFYLQKQMSITSTTVKTDIYKPKEDCSEVRTGEKFISPCTSEYFLHASDLI